DWLAIPSGTRAKAIGLWHGAGNVVVVLLFAGSWFLRRGTPNSPGTPALVLSFAGVALALVTGWLGGELVDRLGVGVDDGAHLDSPNSLSRRPASEEGTIPSGHANGIAAWYLLHSAHSNPQWTEAYSRTSNSKEEQSACFLYFCGFCRSSRLDGSTFSYKVPSFY